MEADNGTVLINRATDESAQATFFRVMSKYPQRIKGASSDIPIQWRPNEVVVAQSSILYGTQHITPSLLHSPYKGVYDASNAPTGNFEK